MSTVVCIMSNCNNKCKRESLYCESCEVQGPCHWCGFENGADRSTPYCMVCRKLILEDGKYGLPTCGICEKENCGGVRCPECKRRAVSLLKECCVRTRELKVKTCCYSWVKKILQTQDNQRHLAYENGTIQESISKYPFAMKVDLEKQDKNVLSQLLFVKWVKEDHSAKNNFKYSLGKVEAATQNLELHKQGLHFTSLDQLQNWGDFIDYSGISICVAQLGDDFLVAKTKVVTRVANVIEFIDSL